MAVCRDHGGGKCAHWRRHGVGLRARGAGLSWLRCRHRGEVGRRRALRHQHERLRLAGTRRLFLGVRRGPRLALGRAGRRPGPYLGGGGGWCAHPPGALRRSARRPPHRPTRCVLLQVERADAAAWTAHPAQPRAGPRAQGEVLGLRGAQRLCGRARERGRAARHGARGLPGGRTGLPRLGHPPVEPRPDRGEESVGDRGVFLSEGPAE